MFGHEFTVELFRCRAAVRITCRPLAVDDDDLDRERVVRLLRRSSFDADLAIPVVGEQAAHLATAAPPQVEEPNTNLKGSNGTT